MLGTSKGKCFSVVGSIHDSRREVEIRQVWFGYLKCDKGRRDHIC